MTGPTTPWVYGDAWVFAAMVAVASGPDGAQLTHVVSAGDALNHAIFLDEELTQGVRRLLGAELITVTDGCYRLTAAGRSLAGRWLGRLSRVDLVLAELQRLPVVAADWSAEPGELRRAVDAWTERAAQHLTPEHPSGSGVGDVGGQLLDRCEQLAGSRLTHPFGDDPAVYKVGERMFALFSGDGPDRVSLKCHPGYATDLVGRHPAITPGYHLNKRHWITVDLAGDLPDGLAEELLVDSYHLVVDALPRARRPPAGSR